MNNVILVRGRYLCEMYRNSGCCNRRALLCNLQEWCPDCIISHVSVVLVIRRTTWGNCEWSSVQTCLPMRPCSMVNVCVVVSIKVGWPVRSHCSLWPEDWKVHRSCGYADASVSLHRVCWWGSALWHTSVLWSLFANVGMTGMEPVWRPAIKQFVKVILWQVS